MKGLWNSFKVAFAMFSKIPMPQADWTKENMKYMFCFLPLVGAVIGGLSAAFACFGMRAGVNGNFAAAVLVALPVFVTGGIHVDGLLDVSDAMSSWQERSRRLEILKDSHAGAFAVISGCVYFLLFFGAYSQIWTMPKAMYVMGLGFMVSRCFAGLGVIFLPKAREEGTAAQFSRNSSDRAVRNVLGFLLIVLLGVMSWIHLLYGAAAFGAAVLVFLYYCRMAGKYFGGTTGDLSGWFICVCEAGMALVLAAVSVFAGG